MLALGDVEENLVPLNLLWKDWAVKEMDYLHGLLYDFNPVIHHIGSTAIPDILF